MIILVALALTGIAFAAGAFGPPASYFADYRSSVGEIRSVTLRDGSSVDLDTGTSFDIEHRRISLYTGQIFVAVKADPQHPFTVETGGGTVRALGTAFSVRSDDSETTVVVTESAVSVAYQGRSERVVAGQSIRYSRAGGLQAPMLADVESLTAWRRGELAFNGRPLADVMRELERYRRGRILILDDEIARLPVSGVFDAKDSDTLFDSIELALPVRVLRFPALVLVQRDQGRSPSR